jgi:aminopeptidase YwaD
MKENQLIIAKRYLNKLCKEIPNRHPGSPGNKETSAWLKEVLKSYNWDVEEQPFPCLDWWEGPARLVAFDQEFEIFSGPYTLSFSGEAELVTVCSITELERAELKGKIVLLMNEIASGQLFPKNFVFYNPDEHKKIYQLLEQKQPAAVIAATGKNPEVAGSLYPFPLFEDADFDIPNAYMKDISGEKLRSYTGQKVFLSIRSERIHSTGENVIARRGPTLGRVVLTAHFDTKKNTPGALDNASGVIILLLAAMMMKDSEREKSIEIAFLNGEDYYAASGEMEYIRQLEGNWQDISLCVNIDAAGNRGKKIAVSQMLTSDNIQKVVDDSLNKFPDLIQGEPWYMGDHMIFAQQNIPSIAITSENMLELCRDITHTPKDDVDLVDPELLVQTAEFIVDLVRKLN